MVSAHGWFQRPTSYQPEQPDGMVRPADQLVRIASGTFA